LCCVFICYAFCGELPTREITSNNIYAFSGNGDTLWMVTELGLNYTIATSDTLFWLGYKTPMNILSIAFGGKTAIATLDTLNFKRIGKIWFYNHTLHTYDSIDFSFKEEYIPQGRAIRGVEAIYSAGYFWIAAYDGGIVQFDPVTKRMYAYFLEQKTVFDPSYVKFDASNGFSQFPDSSKQVISVKSCNSSLDSLSIYVLTHFELYKFNLYDTSWQKIPSRIDTTFGTFVKYFNVFSKPNSRLLFATIQTKKDNNYDTIFFRYNFVDSTFKPFAMPRYVTSVTFGKDSTIYLVRKPNKDEPPRIISCFIGNIKDEGVRSEQSFARRISVAMNGLSPDMITDILYLPKSDTSGSLWIGTASSGVINNGLFFSRQEEKDEESNIPFVYIHSERKVKSGLKECYAYPGILSLDYYNPSRCIFVYSLSKSSKVSINIYDYNMDLVKNIITNEPRLAGKDDPLGNGRSTNRDRDFWDGTNNFGKRVSAGVYYFKITAQSGERGFGKIIVAK